jgi:hypothetical protein
VIPSPVAEERLNVAVLIRYDGCVQFQRAKKLERIAKAFPTVDQDAVELSLAYLDELGQAQPDLDLSELSRRTRGALVQVSPPATTFGDSIEGELRDLFQLYVEPKPTRSPMAFRRVSARRPSKGAALVSGTAPPVNGRRPAPSR